MTSKTRNTDLEVLKAAIRTRADFQGKLEEPIPVGGAAAPCT